MLLSNQFFWLTGIVTVFLIFVTVLKERRKKNRLSSITIQDVDKMTGNEFEIFLTHLLNEQGFEAVKTKASGDFGVDILLKKNGELIAVQAKRYKAKVSLNAVQEVVSGANHYKATKSWVITNSYYTHAAKQLARSNNVKLYSRNDLNNWIRKRK